MQQGGSVCSRAGFSLDDALQKLARGTTGWREDDNFQAEGEGEASAEDGNAVHKTKRVKTSKACCAGSWQEDACTSSQSGAALR